MIWRMNCLRDSQDILLICVLIINLLQSIPVLVVCPFRLDCALLLISWCEICELSLAPGTFIVYSYKYQHDDGRVSYPLCFIFSSPVGKKHLLWVYGTHCSLHCLVIKVVNAGICLCLAGCRPEQMMMYAGSKNKLVHTVQLSKVSERLLTKTPIHNKTLVLTEISGHRFKKKNLNHTLLFMFFFFFPRCLRSETQRTWQRNGSERNFGSSAKVVSSGGLGREEDPDCTTRVISWEEHTTVNVSLLSAPDLI